MKADVKDRETLKERSKDNTELTIVINNMA